VDAEKLYQRYRELQAYVGWGDGDAQRLRAAAPLLGPFLPALIDDFYAEIERHPDARKVISGGQEQIDRLKGSLTRWLGELLTGPYDQGYVVRRWRVGWRHVEIGLDQVYANVALSRLRTGLVGALGQSWPGDRQGLVATIQSLNKASTWTWPRSRAPTRPSTPPACSAASGWRRSARSPGAWPTSCATPSTWSRPPFTIF
jgi:hypothetical protein